MNHGITFNRYNELGYYTNTSNSETPLTTSYINTKIIKA